MRLDGVIQRDVIHGTMVVDNSGHYRLKRQPAIAIVDGVMRVAPSEYSPTESVKNTITDLLLYPGQ